MRSGPKAILYQSTLFRTSELVWVKCAPLSPIRELIRWSLVAVGLGFYVVVANAKGSYLNLEGFLGLLAWHVGYHLQGDVRLASTGDLQESYEGRGGGGSVKTFRQWVTALSEGPDECKLQGKGYQHWINLKRVAWAAPCFLMNSYGLILVPVFLGYRWLITKGLPFDHEILREAHVLIWENSTSFVHFLCYLIAFLGVAAWLSSLGYGVQIRACGGLTDTIALSGADRNRFLEQLAGNAGGAAAPAPEPVRAPAVPVPKDDLPPKKEPAPPPPPPAVAVTAPPAVDLSE